MDRGLPLVIGIYDEAMLPSCGSRVTVRGFPNINAKEGVVGELCEKMRGDLWIGGFSASTTRIYLLYARLFARFHMTRRLSSF